MKKVDAISNFEYGIFLSSSRDNEISDIQASENGKGVFLSYSNFNRIENSVFKENQCGIAFGNSHDNEILMNECKNNSDAIFLDASERNVIQENVVDENTVNGIHLKESSSYNTIESNMISENTLRGMYIRSSSAYNWITNNTICKNAVGIRVAYYSKNNTINLNNICMNAEFGIHGDTNDVEVNASSNWWGDATGPNHESENPDGKGDNITTYVTFSPWLELRVNSPPTATIISISSEKVQEGDKLTFIGGGEDSDSIITYAWRSDKDGELYNGNESEITISSLSPGTHTIFFSVQDEWGAWSEEISMTLTVEKKDDEGSGWALIIMIILIVVVIGVVGCLKREELCVLMGIGQTDDEKDSPKVEDGAGEGKANIELGDGEGSAEVKTNIEHGDGEGKASDAKEEVQGGTNIEHGDEMGKS